jgi:hypothetical protein
MRPSLPKKKLLNRINAGLALVLCLGTFISPAYSEEAGTLMATRPDFPPPFLIAMADPPDFLAPAPTSQEIQEEKETEGAITPFIGTSHSLTLLPTPERPSIAASDVISRERPEITAGVDVDLGTVKFNLGYTLPPNQVDEFVRPLGVDLEPGSDDQRFSLGVKIPF